MDVLLDIIEDLESNVEIQKIFGLEVSRNLVVVADNNDLKIEDGGSVELTQKETESFLRILDEAIRKNAI